MQQCGHQHLSSKIEKNEDEKHKRRMNMDRSAVGTGKKSFDGLTIAWAYRIPGSLVIEEVDDVPN